MSERIAGSLGRRLPPVALSWLAVALLSGVFSASAGAAGGVVAPRGGPGASGAGAASSAAPALRGSGARAIAASGSDVASPADASTTGLTVALNASGGLRYLFWRGSDGRIYEATYTRSWLGPVKTPWFSGSTPSAAVGPQGVLYLAWQGAESHIFEASYDGKWHAPEDLTKANGWRTQGRATSAVSLAVNRRNGAQFLMWRGTDGRIHEAWRRAKWHRPVIMPWTVSGAPTVAVTRAGRQYVFWAGGGGDIEEAWYRGSWQGPLDLTRTYGWGEFRDTSAHLQATIACRHVVARSRLLPARLGLTMAGAPRRPRMRPTRRTVTAQRCWIFAMAWAKDPLLSPQDGSPHRNGSISKSRSLARPIRAW